MTQPAPTALAAELAALVTYGGEVGSTLVPAEMLTRILTALASPTFAAGVEADFFNRCRKQAVDDPGHPDHTPTPAASPAPDSALGEVHHVAAILESWDMKPPPNDFTGHSYEEIAAEICAALRQPAPRADDALRLRNEGARAHAQGTQP